MHVVDDAGTGNAAEIPAEVVALRGVRRGQRVHARRGETVELEHLVVRELAVLADVPHGRNHEVAGRVRELVQHDDRERAAVNDEPLGVVTGGRETEDAALLLVRRLDVLQAPGGPQPLHGGILPEFSRVKSAKERSF